MNKRSSAVARILAALALIGAVVAVVVVVSSGLKDDSSNGSKSHAGQTTTQAQHKHHRTKAKTYVVQTGDTLTAISHKTGVPVAEIEALNPEIDPQILIAGETLKLR